MYVPQDQLSNLGVEHLGYNEKALLFRHEYSLALEEIEEQSKMRREYLSGGIIITGDPGLGKTCFLLYLLFHCLSNGRPTVFQFLPECFVLFTDSGAEVYSHRSIILPDETWALADSDAENPLPCHSFLRACKKHHAFIVQTSSPDQRRYRAWNDDSKLYLSLSSLSMTHGFSVRLIKDHCKKWGPSARIMMNLMTDPGEIRGHTERVKDAALHFAKHFDDFTRQDKVNAMAISHTLFTIRPKGLPSEERSSAIGRIESSYLNRFVIEAIVTQDVLQQIEFYNLVSRHPWFRGSAGYMFEMAVLSWLCANSESNELPCTPARSASPQLTIPVCQGWCMLSYKDQHTLKYLTDCKRPFCVIPIPASKTFPAVDAMIFTDDHIITIQVTITPEHSVKSTGLLQIADSLTKGFRKSRKWCHVFITDRAKNAESLLRRWTEKDVKIKDYDIFISMYSAVLDGKDFCRIKDEEKWKESRVCGSRLYVVIEAD
ncbi:hypothetical protein B0F90DRAFT_602363 [Multifurca ochricompacta]|uniref:Crinkler (CRN) family protein n=1 Tax=Multifurca ochricompacta TaxID=376703 RepID=A0AAD4M2G8_9AGAM|nr:hypothetical protein B0F90DRAFT_602363 [Multifurca ochricompacta]